MPSFTPRERPTKEIHAPWWSEVRDLLGRYNEHVIIYATLSDDDVRNQLAGIEAQAASMTGLLDLLFSFRDTFLVRMIVELTDEQGSVLPVSADLIRQMEPKDIQFIWDAINATVAPEKVEQKPCANEW